MKNKFFDYFLSKYNDSSLEIQKKSRILLVLLFLAFLSGLSILTSLYFTEQTYIAFLPYIIASVWCIIMLFFLKFGLYYFASGFFVLMFIIFNFILMILDSGDITAAAYRFTFIMTVIMILSCLVFHKKIKILFVSVIGSGGILFHFFNKFYLPHKTIDYNTLITFLINISLFLLSGAFGWFILSISQKLFKEADDIFNKSKSEKDEAERRLRITEIYTKPSLFKIISQGLDPTQQMPLVEESAVLFSGLYGFTKFLEDKDPLIVVKFLNSYFEIMNKVITSNFGEIDKLIGDSILAVFDKTDNAVRSAVEMRKKIQFLFMKHEPFPEINSGIGVHYGQFVKANIGSKEKKDYTIIGNAVNTTVRLESFGRIYSADIIISEDMKKVLTYPFQIRFLDNVLIKGRVVPIKIYEIYDHKDEKHKEFIKKNTEKMNKAFDYYTEGEFKLSGVIYDNILKTANYDSLLLKFYLNRCNLLENKKNSGNLKKWDGIFQLS
ncbi:MAG: adenylate/guanylate cyclase domain-containing protein [Spirochaetes bacterium]|nr:adenylate/guanylate cyclase domain-containing protein [Spirochaetota bacterium]